MFWSNMQCVIKYFVVIFFIEEIRSKIILQIVFQLRETLEYIHNFKYVNRSSPLIDALYYCVNSWAPFSKLLLISSNQAKFPVIP